MSAIHRKSSFAALIRPRRMVSWAVLLVTGGCLGAGCGFVGEDGGSERDPFIVGGKLDTGDPAVVELTLDGDP